MRRELLEFWPIETFELWNKLQRTHESDRPSRRRVENFNMENKSLIFIIHEQHINW